MVVVLLSSPRARRMLSSEQKRRGAMGRGLDAEGEAEPGRARLVVRLARSGIGGARRWPASADVRRACGHPALPDGGREEGEPWSNKV